MKTDSTPAPAPELSRRDRRALAVIHAHSGPEGIYTRGRAFIAAQLGVAATTAKHALESLEAAGLIRRAGRVRAHGGRTTAWQTTNYPPTKKTVHGLTVTARDAWMLIRRRPRTTSAIASILTIDIHTCRTAMRLLAAEGFAVKIERPWNGGTGAGRGRADNLWVAAPSPAQRKPLGRGCIHVHRPLASTTTSYAADTVPSGDPKEQT